jgi:hypothetical protein
MNHPLDEFELKLPNGAFSTYDMEAIIPELEKLHQGDIYLEVGVDKGKSLACAWYMAGIRGVSIHGCDVNKTKELTKFLEDKPEIKFYQVESKNVAHFLWDKKDKISLLFIDGDHSYQGCKTDIESWLPYMKEDGVIFFHDHDETSPGVMWAASEFYSTHGGKAYKIFKRDTCNTSMTAIYL